MEDTKSKKGLLIQAHEETLKKSKLIKALMEAMASERDE